MLEKTNFFNDFNMSNKEVGISENYFNNSDEFVLIACTGFLDTYNSTLFMSTIQKFLSLKPRKIVVMDIASINYMSSTGIGSLVSLTKYCREKDVKLYIMGMQPNVAEVFSLLGFTQFFDYITELKDIKEEKIVRSLFPLKVKCPYCQSELVTKKIGSFRCPQCLNTFRVVEKYGLISVEKR